jgi:hypothetical protein
MIPKKLREPNITNKPCNVVRIQFETNGDQGGTKELELMWTSDECPAYIIIYAECDMYALYYICREAIHWQDGRQQKLATSESL